MNEFNLNKKYNWETAHNPLVKKYVADLYQDGTATPPLATELFNNTELYFDYVYIDPGVYAVIASKDIFTNGDRQKCQAAISNPTYVDNLGGPSGYSIIVFPVWYNILIILTSDLTAETDGILGGNGGQQNALELTFYP